MVTGHLQSQELVAALAREKLARPEHPAHPVRDFDQDQIPGAVAEHVVDILEPVDVDRECSQLVCLLVGLGGVERQPLVEGDTIGQSGHGIVERELVDAFRRFGARAQVDDVGGKAAAHHQQDRTDHGKAEHAGRNQVGRQHDRGVGDGGGGDRQRVVHGADHERQHDRGAMAAPSRHRAVGAADRECAEAEAKQKRHDDAIGAPLRSAGDVPGLQSDQVHGENADPHHQPAKFGCQREVPAADFEAGQAGRDGDDQNGAGGNRLEAAVERRVERKNRDEGGGPQCRAGADRGHEQPAITGRSRSGAGASEMPHPDPGAEQADHACHQNEQLMVCKNGGWLSHDVIPCRNYGREP